MRNPGLKLLAWAIAVLAWLWVQSKQVETLNVRVDVELQLADDLINTEPPFGTVVAVVRGSLAAARRAQVDRPTLLLDLKSEKAGAHDVPLEGAKVADLPAGLQVVGFSPEVLHVRLEPRSTRSVEVAAATTGQPDEHHRLRKVVVAPAVVEITGPRAVMGTLSQVRTRPVDIGGWSASQVVPVELELPRGVETVEGWSGTANVELEALETTITVSDVPVLVQAPGWQAVVGSERVSVVLEGPTTVLRSLRLDRVLAVVELPEEPTEASYRARFEGSRAPRYEVIVPREDVVRVTEAPPQIEVIRR